jgi:hypothetical protein
LGGTQVQALLGFVQHNKVVASALHFGEADVHVWIIGEDFGHSPSQLRVPVFKLHGGYLGFLTPP